MQNAFWNQHETLAERQDPPDYGMRGGMRSDQIMALAQQAANHEPERELVSYEDILDGP